MKKSTPNVTIFQVRTSQDKFFRIATVAKDHFERKEALLILTPPSATDFVDRMLWSYPKESFLPHSIAREPTNSLIVITDGTQNPNGSKAIFNLTPDPVTLPLFTVIYELEDLSSPDKKEQAKHSNQKRCHMG